MVSDIFGIWKQPLSEPNSTFLMASILARTYEAELLSFLKFFKRQQLLGFSYEKKDGRWSLFLHFPNGVIQVSGKKKLKDTIYASLVTETVPWNQ